MTSNKASIKAHSGAAQAPQLAEVPPNKPALVVRLLTRPKGATLTEIASATNWQLHSCRAYLSGLRKQGRTLAKEQRSDGAFAYHVVVSNVEAEIS